MPASFADDYAKKIDSIAAANQTLVKVDSLDLLLPRLLEIAEDTTAAEASSFLRFDPHGGTLIFEVVRNKGASASMADTLEGKFMLRPGEGIAGKAMQERSTLIVNDVSKAEHFSPRIDNRTSYTTKSILCVPVVHLDEPLGVIQLLNPQGRERFDEIDAKALEIFASMAAVAIVRARHMQEQLRQKELEAQLEFTARIQRHCWPSMPHMGHGSHVWGRSLPAKHVGGDLYDIISLQDGSFLLYLADVSGKGLPAGFVMAALWSAIRGEAHKDLPVAALLERINAATFPFLSGEVIFATICLLRYWPREGRVELALGGHNPPLFMDCQECAPLPRMEGLPLGTIEDCHFESRELHLPPGAMLVLYSDGVNEAFSPEGKMFGVERLVEILRREQRQDFGPAVFKALEQWCAGAGQSDDISLLYLWRE